MNTHMLIANELLNQANGNKIYLINRKRFIWGNIKPDCVSKYKLKKHYYNESIYMILDKIYELSNLSISDVIFDYGKNKFSEELGVVCHFLCDFFCVPHNQEWHFKNALKKHVIYEKVLAAVAKKYKPIPYIYSNLKVEDIEKFIVYHQLKYQRKVSYTNDLTFSYFVCNSIINCILNQVVINEYNREEKVS